MALLDPLLNSLADSLGISPYILFAIIFIILAFIVVIKLVYPFIKNKKLLKENLSDVFPKISAYVEEFTAQAPLNFSGTFWFFKSDNLKNAIIKTKVNLSYPPTFIGNLTDDKINVQMTTDINEGLIFCSIKDRKMSVNFKNQIVGAVDYNNMKIDFNGLAAIFESVNNQTQIKINENLLCSIKEYSASPFGNSIGQKYDLVFTAPVPKLTFEQMCVLLSMFAFDVTLKVFRLSATNTRMPRH